MSLSFEESLGNARVASASIPVTESDVAVANVGIMTLDETGAVAAFSGEGGSWFEHPNYVRYPQFSDDNLSTITDTKDIILNVKQFGITQEENSQYIPFEAPLRYDGFDLSTTTLKIHFITSGGYHDEDDPVNVTYNGEKIRFGWLISPEATQHAGKLKFEIRAYGYITGSDGVRKGYVWKTKTNDKLNILESLCNDKEEIEGIDKTWMQELVTDIAESVTREIASEDISAQVQTATEAASLAVDAAHEAQNAAITAVATALADYSTTEEMQQYVSDAVAGVDVSGKLTEYAKTSEVEAMIGDLGDNDTVVGYVDEAVKSVDVSNQLTEYVKTETLE